MTESTRIALALGSGGARGYAHIGAIRELERRGFTIAGIAGSSMGAVIGGMYAGGKLDEYEEWALTLNQLEVFRLLDPSILEPGAIRASKILDRIREMLGDIAIEDLPIPFIAVATDLAAGRSVWFQNGPLDAAIRASIAIPGVISPSVLNGRVLADGGILDPLPVGATASIDANMVVGISVNGEPEISDHWTPVRTDPGAIEELLGKFRRGAEQLRSPVSSVMTRLSATPSDENSEIDDTAEPDDAVQSVPKLGRLEVMNRSLDVMQAALSRYQRAGHPPDLLVEIPRTACRALDFHRAAELIELGRTATAAALDSAGLDVSDDD
ncbi:patatin-like phospholipase family protein [Antrihabitans cavernicola]|uniref:Esterase n=1 Tax=Antrihabitans cavernicola TaxID=2495913 RepID=A0A5A7S9G3_9NOCA|nr:patatin-like phospholipase family protein [Spelaeibacter cavernicola]KAA0020082.1 esterase [Spelaeibacter cavernicola]